MQRQGAETAHQHESVAFILQCAECDDVWLPADEEHWRAYVTDDEPPQLAFYCPGRRRSAMPAVEECNASDACLSRPCPTPFAQLPATTVSAI